MRIQSRTKKGGTVAKINGSWSGKGYQAKPTVRNVSRVRYPRSMM